VSPKSGTLKSPPKGLETTNFCKTYYNVVRDVHVTPPMWNQLIICEQNIVLQQYFHNQIGKYTTNPDYT